MHLPYGPTQIFLTVEPEELLCVKDPESKSWISGSPGEQRAPSLRNERNVTVRIDFRLALNKTMLDRALEFVRGGLADGCPMRTMAMSPKPALEYFQRLVGGGPPVPQAQLQPEGTEIILSKATCHPFLDLLGSLGPVAYPDGGRELVESIDHHLLGNDDKAISLLLDPLKEMRGGLELVLVDGGYPGTNVHTFSGVDHVGELCQSYQRAGLMEIPEGRTALIGSLGGVPNDSVPSASIPYLLSALASWPSEVAGFIAMWDQSLMDLPFFASSNLPQDELLGRLERRFDWHDLVLYMIRRSGSDDRTRLVTSMPSVLVAKTLRWKVLGTGSDLLRSMKRSVKGEFKLAITRDVSMTFAGRRSEGGGEAGQEN